MTAILFLLGAALAGVGVVRRTFPRLLDGAEQTLWGIVAGWMLSALAGYATARAAGRLTFFTSLAAFALTWLAALACLAPDLRRLLRARRTKTRAGVTESASPHIAFESLADAARRFARACRRPERAWLLLVLALFGPLFWRFYHTRMLQPGAEGVYSGGSTWYDIEIHLAVTNSFLHGRNFPPVYTPFPPAPLLYPFLPDFQTALLASLGLSLRASLVLTSLALALCVTGLFYSFARRLLQDWDAKSITFAPAAAALATVLFLLNGGLGFVYFFADWRRSGQSLFQFWSRLNVNYANMGERHIHWTNLINDTLLPQRAGLFGLSAAFVVFTAFVVAWRGWSGDATKRQDETKARGEATARPARPSLTPERWQGWRVLLPAGVLTGLLPFFHTHTYIGVGLVSGFLFLLKPRRAWLAFWLPAVLLAAPHFAHLLAHASGQGFLRLQPGWRGHDHPFWPLYWLVNVGVPLLLAVPAWLSAPRAWRVFYLAFAALLAFALVVVVSPNDYDNIKLMYYWHALTSVFVGAWLVRLAAVRRRPVLAFVLTLLCVASALLALRHESNDRRLLFNRDELAAADFARRQTAPRALFLTAPSVHQPALSLAGRPVLRAFMPLVWSHGYEFAEREADVKAALAGRADARELLAYYRVDYVYFGPHERELPGADESFFAANLPAVFSNDTVRVYDVRPPEVRARHDAGDDGTAKLLAPYPPREYAARLDRDPVQLLVEFPRAAFAVYRYHRVAYGRRPRYREFLADMRSAGRGLRVGAPGWRQVLEQNKRALADSFPARPDLQALFAAPTDEQYVDALYANAGLAPPREERARLLAGLAGKTETRAGALLRVAEDARLFARDYDDAYVLMHYFGYLRRDPDAPPDRDLSGFNFWLDDLRRTRDYRSLGRVFIEAGEYKDRKP